MRRINVVFAGLLVITLLISTQISLAQDGGVPLPEDAGDAYVLFPDLILDAPLSAGALQQRYILLARSGNILSVTATASEPGLIARIELDDVTGAVLAEQAADAASDSVVLSYEVMAEGWYYVNVSLASAPSDTSAYTLELTGTTRAVYDLLAAGAPPAVSGAHIIVSTAQVTGELEAAPTAYLIPLAASDTLSLMAEGTSQPRLRFTQYEDGNAAQTVVAEPAEAGAAVNYSFVSDQDQWVRVEVEPTQAGAFVLDVTHPRASGMAMDLGAEGGMAAAGGSGELCGGVPARFAVGDVIVVSQEGDNLLLLSDYTGGNDQSLGLLVQGNLLEVLDPPVCYFSQLMQQDTWFWYVYSTKHDLNGWVPDGFEDERWVCAQDDPACNQAASCDMEPYAFNVGDRIIVSQTGDDLQIARVPGPTNQIIALASWNDELDVLDGPVCYYSDWHAGGLWYWKIFSETDNTEGWVVQGTPDEVWLCPISDPTCDQ
jgi:hypothetical protein